MANQRLRNFAFTINNYTGADVEKVDTFECTYMLYSREVGESGTPHLQGYCEMANAMTLSALKKKFHQTAHLEKTGGTGPQNRTYIVGPYEKDGKTKPYNADHVERGVMKLVQGQRTDLELTREVLKETGKLSAVVEIAKSYQSIRMAEVYLKYKERARADKTFVRWYWGPTGTGKSRAAYEEFPGAYTCGVNTKWWEGYDAHAAVIIDDMRWDSFKFADLLKLLDRYEFRVECKGGIRQMLAKNIVITSPYTPQEMFNDKTDEDIGQLIRRIEEVKEFRKIEIKENKNLTMSL